ncbi:MAG: hypothetical protein EPO08_14080, partial [Rhodospirillaceae bacterium]
MARSRRPLFRQRKSLSRRLAAGFSVALVAILCVLGLTYLTLPWTTGFALRTFLNHTGWGPVTVHVTRFDARSFELRDLSLGGHVVTLADLTITYSPRDLLHRRVGDITMNGLTVTAKWTEDGIALGPIHLAHLTGTSPSPAQTPLGQQPGKAGQLTRPLPFRHLAVTATNLVLDLPKNPVTISVSVDITPSDGRWEGQFAADGSARQGNTTTHLFGIGWQGVFSPAEPENWPSKGTIDLTAAAFPVSDSDATISASGHLDLVTGNGGVALTAPGRIIVNVSALRVGSLSGVPEAWVARLANGVAFDAAGSGGGPALIWRSQDGTSTQQADLDLGISAGETSMRAIVRGKTSGAPGVPPENVAIDEVRLGVNHVPLPVGELTGHVDLSGLTGPLVLVQGNAHADITITNAALGSLRATSLAVASDGQLHLDGPTIALAPRSLSVTATDASTPALSFPGQTTFALVDPGGESQNMGLVLSESGSPTYTFGLSAAAHNIRVARPVQDETQSEAVTVDIPHVRLEGYVVPATGLYDAGLRITDGLISHPIADLQVSQFSARFLPDGGTGTGKAQLVRFLGEPQHSTHSGGLNLKYDFNISNQSFDLASSLSSSKSQPLGGLTAQMNFGAQTGGVTLDTPKLVFGQDAISAADVFTTSMPISGLTGTAVVSLKADWGPTGGSSSGRMTLDDIAFQSAGFSVAGFSTDLNLNALQPLKANKTQHMRAASLTAGLQLHDLSVDASLPGEGAIILTSGSAAIAGGKASIADANIQPGGSQGIKFPLSLARLELAPLCTQAHVEGLSASG